jgi:hypothetical protein
MSRCIWEEYGASSTLMVNQRAPKETMMVVARPFPRHARSTTAARKGATAVATLAWGERLSIMLHGDTTGV